MVCCCESFLNLLWISFTFGWSSLKAFWDLNVLIDKGLKNSLIIRVNRIIAAPKSPKAMVLYKKTRRLKKGTYKIVLKIPVIKLTAYNLQLTIRVVGCLLLVV